MRTLHLAWASCLGLVGCHAAPITSARAPIAARAGAERLIAPTRPTSVDSFTIDVARLPRLSERKLDDPRHDMGPGARFRVHDDGLYDFVGAQGLELDVMGTRAFLVRGERPIGGGIPDGAEAARHSVWRGPAEAVGERLRFVCYEGSIVSDAANAGPDSRVGVPQRAYEVLAEPVVPGLVYAFRAGRVEEGSFHAPRPLLAPRTVPEPCMDGADRVELIGPAPVWTSTSVVDPRDAAITACGISGACTFSRVTAPIERGDLAVALVVTSSSPIDPNAFIPISNIATYTFEFDWTDGGPAPLGRVFVARDQASRVKLHPAQPVDVTYYEF